MIETSLNGVISTILKHDRKTNTYKFALLRSINDVVLSYPDIRNTGRDVAIPLRILAEFWLAYYWPFVDPNNPIEQGIHPANKADMAFRELLTQFRYLWSEHWRDYSRPSDGFFIINEFRVARNHASYLSPLAQAYNKTISKISQSIRQPIQYAGPGQWSVFPKPVKYSELTNTIAIPGTMAQDECLIVRADLWQAFLDLSLWIEALCIHEWCLFTESLSQARGVDIDRGIVYILLTDRPDNRRPLTWERNQIELLLMEGVVFQCPWTEKRIQSGVEYDLDHLVAVSVYPINELWNLVPADPYFNSHKKRDRLPSVERLERAQVLLADSYANYQKSLELDRALSEDVAVRFDTVSGKDFADGVANAVIDLITSIGESRNLAQF